MKKKHLNALIEVLPYLSELLQEDLNIAVVGSGKFLAVQDGKRVKSREKVGDDFPMDDFLREVLAAKKTVSQISPKGHFDIPTMSTITPVMSDDQTTVDAVVFVVKDMEQQITVESASGKIYEVFGEINAALQEISSGSTELSEYIKDIVEYSARTAQQLKEMDNIIQIMKKVSAQSNLLALNATIEAARSGEAGRGFGVVAGEMGKLSKQSKESVEVVTRSLLALKEAVETIEGRVGRIGVSSEKQASATEQIAASVSQMLEEVKRLSEAARLKDK